MTEVISDAIIEIGVDTLRDMTNETVMGIDKNELSKQLGLHKNKVNSRDYMSKGQLAAAELLQITSLDTIQANDVPADKIMAVHLANCKELESYCQKVLHRTHHQEPQSLRQSRLEVVQAPVPAIETTRAVERAIEQPKIAHHHRAKTITYYFIHNH